MRAYAIIPVNDIGALGVDFSLGAEATSGVRWGMYIVATPRAQLVALDADPGVVVICAFWQLDDVISTAKRNEVDAWAAVHFPSLPPVPAGWIYRQVVDELYSRANEHYTSAGLFLRPGGMTPEPASIRVLALSPDPADIENLDYVGDAWKLIDIGDYGLWELSAHQDELVRIHNLLWEVAPSGTFGLLGAVNVYGVSFYDYAVMDTFDHPASELLARRDRIATYLEGLGYDDTATLRAATTEHAQVAGVVTALGYSMNTLWNVMHG